MKRVLLLAVVGAFLLPAAPAFAQTGYPPGPCTAANSTKNLGTFQVGQTVTGTLTGSPCPFLPGSTESMTVNGAAAGTKTANNAGGVPFNLSITSSTSGLLNDPVTVPLHCGSNSISATGPTTGGNATATGTFTVQCAAAAPASAAQGGRVAFTGANILRWSLAAIALIGVGALFMLASRRRRSLGA